MRCRECKYLIVNGKCACNSDVGQGRYLPSVAVETARWIRRGALPTSADR